METRPRGPRRLDDVWKIQIRSATCDFNRNDGRRDENIKRELKHTLFEAVDRYYWRVRDFARTDIKRDDENTGHVQKRPRARDAIKTTDRLKR